MRRVRHEGRVTSPTNDDTNGSNWHAIPRIWGWTTETGSDLRDESHAVPFHSSLHSTLRSVSLRSSLIPFVSSGTEPSVARWSGGRETNGGYEWRTEDGTKTRQRRYEVKGTWGDDTRWTESVTPGPWSSGVVSSPHTVPFRFTVVSVPFAHSLRSSHSLHLTPSEASGTEWEGAEWRRKVDSERMTVNGT